MDLVETTFLIMIEVFHQLWPFMHLGLSSCVVDFGGPALIVMKDHEAWIMYDGAELKINLIKHIFGTVQKPSLGVEGFRGHRGYHCLGIQILPKSERYQ